MSGSWSKALLWLFVINLGIAFGAGLYEDPHRRIPVAELVSRLRADRIFTFSYFIPTMIGLSQAQDPAESVAAAVRWANLNYLRHALVLAAWLAALKAFSLLYRQRGLRGAIACSRSSP